MKKKVIIGGSILILVLALFALFFFSRKESKLDTIQLLQDYTDTLGSLEQYTFDVQYEDTYQFRQNFEGVRVYGGSVIAILDEDTTTKILDYRYRIPDDFDIQPVHEEGDLLDSARTYVGDDAILFNEELIIYPLSMDEFTLAYLYEFSRGTVILKDEDESLLSAPRIYHTTTLYRPLFNEEDLAEFQTSDSNYRLYDRKRNIEVYTIKDGYEYIPNLTYIERNTGYYKETIWRNLEEANNELETYYAIRTIQNLAKVYDYYQENFDFKSIKLDEDYKLNVYTNLDNIGDSEDTNIYYPFSNNAALFYFNENDIRIYFGSEHTFNEDIEVVGHEYTHGYFRTIIKPDGSTYNNAINEGYADTMGLIIGAYYRDGVLDGTIANRNVAESTYQLGDYRIDTEEHDASFLISRVAYLMSIDEGLDMSLYDLGNLWFKSLYHLPKNIVNYSDVEVAVLTEALILGYSKDEVKAMAKIFESVGYPDVYNIVMKDVVDIRYGHTTVSEENEGISEEEIYMSYLENKEYESLTNEWYMQPEVYSMYDIDGNGILELMLSFNDYGFGNTLILTYNPVDERIEKVWDKYIYGGLRYHEGRKEIVYSETKPFAETSASTFANLVNGEIVVVRDVLQDQGNYYIWEGHEKRESSAEENGAYYDDLIYFEEHDLSSIGA